MCEHAHEGIHIEFGGFTTTADSVGANSTGVKANGSNLVFFAESVEEVRKLIEADPYWDANVVGSHSIPTKQCVDMALVGQGEGGHPSYNDLASDSACLRHRAWTDAGGFQLM